MSKTAGSGDQTKKTRPLSLSELSMSSNDPERIRIPLRCRAEHFLKRPRPSVSYPAGKNKQTVVCWRYGTAIGRTSTLLECPWGISTWQRDVGMEWKSKKLNQKWELNAAVSACSMAESPRKKNTCTFVQLPTSNWLAEVDISHLGQLKYGALRLNKEKPRMHMEKWQ